MILYSCTRPVMDQLASQCFMGNPCCCAHGLRIRGNRFTKLCTRFTHPGIVCTMWPQRRSVHLFFIDVNIPKNISNKTFYLSKASLVNSMQDLSSNFLSWFIKLNRHLIVECTFKSTKIQKCYHSKLTPKQPCTKCTSMGPDACIPNIDPDNNWSSQQWTFHQ